MKPEELAAIRRGLPRLEDLAAYIMGEFGTPAKHAIANAIELLSPDLDRRVQGVLSRWWTTKAIDDTVRIEGLTMADLTAPEYGGRPEKPAGIRVANMSPTNAINTLDWLTREPETALRLLRRGVDRVLPPRRYAPYADLIGQETTYVLRTYVPFGYERSLLVPTKQWGDPAYVGFAFPAFPRPGEPMVHGVPRFWFTVDAHGRLLDFSSVRPYTDISGWERIEKPIGTARSIVEAEAVLAAGQATIAALMDGLVPHFFESKEGDAATRAELLAALTDYVGKDDLPRYEAVAPDFFAWLRS